MTLWFDGAWARGHGDLICEALSRIPTLWAPFFETTQTFDITLSDPNAPRGIDYASLCQHTFEPQYSHPTPTPSPGGTCGDKCTYQGGTATCAARVEYCKTAAGGPQCDREECHGACSTDVAKRVVNEQCAGQCAC